MGGPSSPPEKIVRAMIDNLRGVATAGKANLHDVRVGTWSVAGNYAVSQG